MDLDIVKPETANLNSTYTTKGGKDGLIKEL